MGWGTTRAARCRARVMAALGAVVVAGAAHASPPTVAVRVLPEGGGADARLAATLVTDAAPPTVALVPVVRLEPQRKAPAPGALEEAARGLELRLKFREAAGVWQKLLDRLVASATLVLDPRRIARVQVALAAAYAEAGEPDLALLQFREALALDAGFRPGPAYPPRVRAIFAKARAAGPALPPTPSDEVLDDVATRLGAKGVLWVAVGREDGQRVLVRRLHLQGARDASAEVRTRLPPDPDDAATRLATEASRLRGELATRFPAPPPPLPPAVPWFRRTWVVATGIGVAGAVVAGIVAAETLGPRRVTVVVKH
jgi:hypothetical protein